MSHSRLQLPFDDWPENDRIAWTGLFQAGDLLSGDIGAAVDWRPDTRKSNAKNYGRFLGWLSSMGFLDRRMAPEDRVTLETVTAYARHLMAELRPRTVATYVIGLKTVIQKMAPDRDWRWLRDLTNRLDIWAAETKPEKVAIPRGDVLFTRAIADLDRLAEEGVPTRRAQLCYRDDLIVALLVLCPVRRLNVATIEIDQHLIKSGNAWRLRFAPQETKTHSLTLYEVPSELGRHIEYFIANVRSQFHGAAATSRLWMGCKQAPVAEHTIYERVRKATGRLVGVSIPPQGIRGVSASLLAGGSTEEALLAPAILKHKSDKTTEAHYIRTDTVSAGKLVAGQIREIRNRRPGSEI